jgi:quercetin dioxygenase-like cupin family protein
MADEAHKESVVCTSLLGVFGAALCAAPVQATPSTAKSTILAQSIVSPVTLFGHGRTAAGGPWAALLATYGQTDGYVVDNQFLPGQTTGWHSHPGPSLIFVIAGAITNYDSGAPQCAPVTYAAGSSFVDEGGRDVHMLVNKGSVTAETIAVQLIPSGQPRRIDKPEPANCHA